MGTDIVEELSQFAQRPFNALNISMTFLDFVVRRP